MLVWMTATCLLLLLLKIREFPVLQPDSFSQTLDRRLKGKPQVSEHGLTSPPTHYRLYGRWGGGRATNQFSVSEMFSQLMLFSLPAPNCTD